MTKQIETLVEDIESVLTGALSLTPQQIEEQVEEFGEEIKQSYRELLESRNTTRDSNVLRLSKIGSPCTRKLWYEHQEIGEKESLPASAHLKFYYGHILEALVLSLSKLSGHDVRGEQDQVSIAGIDGHRDAVIDGHVVDVKSASSYSFKKFRDGGLQDADPFGYIDQLGGYVHASTDASDTGYFLVVDKTLGHLTLSQLPDLGETLDEFVQRMSDKIGDVTNAETLPDRGFEDEAKGKGGNRGLGTTCSYCHLKQECWPELKTYIYSTGPSFLTHVEKEPRVPQLNSDSEYSF